MTPEISQTPTLGPLHPAVTAQHCAGYRIPSRASFYYGSLAGAASLGVPAVEVSGAFPVTHSQIAPGQKRRDVSLLSHSRLSTPRLSYRITHLEGYE